MYELTGRLQDVSLDYQTGKPRVMIEINEKQAAFALFDELKDCEKLSLKIGKFREKRSLDANAYMWVLCDKLAKKLSGPKNKYTKEDIYRDAIKEIGVFKDFNNLPPKDARTLAVAWRRLGTGWVTEQVDFMPDGENVNIRCYYGSSQYNKKQMSRLIDNIVQDCHAAGIETKTPDEIENLKSLWRAGEN